MLLRKKPARLRRGQGHNAECFLKFGEVRPDLPAYVPVARVIDHATQLNRRDTTQLRSAALTLEVRGVGADVGTHIRLGNELSDFRDTVLGHEDHVPGLQMYILM